MSVPVFSRGDPDAYRPLFALTIIPGLIVIAFILAIPESPRAPSASAPAPSAKAPAPSASVPAPSAIAPAPPASAPALSAIAPAPSLRPIAPPLFVIFLFSLGNASDAFLLLRLSEVGIASFWIPLLWSGLHGQRWRPRSRAVSFRTDWGGATSSLPAGFSTRPCMLLSRSTIGIGALVASLIFGLIWTRVSPGAAFLTGASLAVAATLLLYLLFPDEEDSRHQ